MDPGPMDPAQGGNTEPLARTMGTLHTKGDATAAVKKKRVRPRSRKGWCFTWNNKDAKDLDVIAKVFEERGWKYTAGCELAPTTGTPHIQGFVLPGQRTDFKSIAKLLPGAHIEAIKGSISENDAYCRKDGNFKSNITATDGDERPLKRRLRDDALSRYQNANWKWRDWQRRLLDRIDREPDRRTIVWIYDGGNTGKTELFRYLIARDEGVVFVKGTEKDIALQVERMISERQITPRVCIANIPRARRNRISYNALESLKDGIVFSTKYEGSENGACLFPNPHVIVFANFEPVQELLSKDRWEIIKND